MSTSRLLRSRSKLYVHGGRGEGRNNLGLGGVFGGVGCKGEGMNVSVRVIAISVRVG